MIVTGKITMKEKLTACFFELFGERIVDRQHLGSGYWVARRGWRLKFRGKYYYHFFEDFE